MRGYKRSFFVLILMVGTAQGIAYAQNQVGDNTRATERKIEAVNEKLKEMTESIEQLKKEHQEIKTLIMDEHKRTRKWISAR